MDGSDLKILHRRDATIKAILDEESSVIKAAHFAGASGSEVVQRRTGLIDRVLRDVHERLSDPHPMPALLAVGGYGRGELNPFSDIDIMFLCRNESERQRSPEMLYALWDSGMDVGYSVRTIDECVDLARSDIKIRTSLMESRLIAGDTFLYEKFIKTMSSEIFYWRTEAFIADKISDRRTTRLKYGGSLYLREPNTKEGAGGLRDFHTALWVASARYRIHSLADLISIGTITEGQYAVFSRSRNFLWKLRNEIHYISGRKNDQLTFDLQERAARDFGYRDSAHLLAVERFMKTYFLHARNITEFSNIVMDAVLRKPGRRFFTRTRNLGVFSVMGKTLIPSSETLFLDNPAFILDAFEVMQTQHVIFSDRLKAMIRECRINDGLRNSQSAAARFIALLDNPDGLYETLSLMKELRFLGRYIPEFRSVQSLAKHDTYHKYTVDEHILFSIRSLQNLHGGRYPVLTTLLEAFKGLRHRWVLMLAALLHDLGKTFRSGHEHRGVELADRILARLGIAAEERWRILFLIRNHLVMASLSQRRELTDRKVIADFARLVEDRENLDMLYLLTYADISAVSPTAWTQWKAALLQELYLRTRGVLDQTAAAVEEEQARLIAASERIRTAAEGTFARQELDAIMISLPEEYILHTPSKKAVEHMGMMQRLPHEGLVIQHRHYPEKGYTELTVCAYDAYGMFYRTAGTLAAKNLNILRAQVHTTKVGVMIDTLQITDPDGNICPHEEVWESLKTELKAVLTGQRPVPEPGPYLFQRATPGTVTPSVEFENHVSDAFTIIDITARDRVGLLYDVTKTLYMLNLDIASAKIVTEGVRVMDSFYITDLLRNKITDTERMSRIREAVLKVLE